MKRQDYSFPFRIDPTSREGQLAADYPTHVDHMVRQILLTDPGERADLPEFGCGIRRLIFAGNSSALAATTQLLVQQALNRWLSDQITVQSVTAESMSDEGTLLVTVQYFLIETQSSRGLQVIVQ